MPENGESMRVCNYEGVSRRTGRTAKHGQYSGILPVNWCSPSSPASILTFSSIAVALSSLAFSGVLPVLALPFHFLDSSSFSSLPSILWHSLNAFSQFFGAFLLLQYFSRSPAAFSPLPILWCSYSLSILPIFWILPAALSGVDTSSLALSGIL